MRYDSTAKDLNKTGLSQIPLFLTPHGLEQTRADFAQVHDAGRFKPASIGQGANKQVHPETRRDEICWLDRNHASKVQARLWNEFEILRATLNRRLYLGLTSFDAHYSCYSTGGFYRRHLDHSKKNNARVVSVILYLNLDWKPADGGQLRVHHSHGPGMDPKPESKPATYTDIEPIGGTLVCFMSREKEHEVLVSHNRRISFTGWFY